MGILRQCFKDLLILRMVGWLGGLENDWLVGWIMVGWLVFD